MTFALCLAFLVLAVVGPLPSEPGYRSKVIITAAVAWCLVMLAIATALLVMARGWPS